MTKLGREAALDAAYEAGIDEDSIREDYSGRAMYGDRCFGIVGSEGEAALFLVELAAAGHEDEARGLASAWRSDSMGLEGIFYFPGWTLEPDPALRVIGGPAGHWYALHEGTLVCLPMDRGADPDRPPPHPDLWEDPWLAWGEVEDPAPGVDDAAIARELRGEAPPAEDRAFNPADRWGVTGHA